MPQHIGTGSGIFITAREKVVAFGLVIESSRWRDDGERTERDMYTYIYLGIAFVSMHETTA